MSGCGSRRALSADEFAALVRLTGLTLTPGQLDELPRIHDLILAMCERVRTPRGMEAEPAHVFRPIEGRSRE